MTTDKQKEYARQHYLDNKEDIIAKATAWNKANKDKVNTRARVAYLKNPTKRVNYHRQARYGLTLPEYTALLTKQHNCCAICKTTFTKTPQVDHCHTTLKVRGLLCVVCNVGLGVYERGQKNFKEYLDG